MSDVRTEVAEVNPYAAGDSNWQAAEAERLKDMDSFLEPFTREDLAPVIGTMIAENPRGINLLDIGAANSTTVEDISAQKGVEYYALDVNADMLAERATPAERTIVSPSQEMDVESLSFDVTYSRAATAWSPDPAASIGEQLRVTRDGGIAVFSEFDWSVAGSEHIDTSAGQALNGAKAILELALSLQGFRPEYGKKLGEDIDAAATDNRLAYVRHENTHVLPSADYRAFMLNNAEQLRQALAEFDRGMPVVLRNNLENYMKRIETAPGTLQFLLPAVVTHTVEIMGRTDNPFDE